MKSAIFLIIMVVCLCSCVSPVTDPERFVIEVSKPMKGGRGLGTMGYQALDREQFYLDRVTEKPLLLWGEEEKSGDSKKGNAKKKYSLSDQKGEYVGWFGIVRGKSVDKKSETTELLLEHKYFDGLTDLHIQIVSIYGGGDFKTVIPRDAADIPYLSLVRVYGKVSVGKDKLPLVTPEYIRVWHWGLFSFMDYGKDYSNPKWVKLRKVSGADVYSPRPTTKFYEDRLGKRESE